MDGEYNPRVFISYSQDSSAFADKVLGFSNSLRREGIDAILDQYEESPPNGWPRWMEHNISTADYVLVISSLGYQQKIMGTVGAGIGKGAKWESSIIYQMLYMWDTLNEKIIPIIFDKSDINYIPIPIQGNTYYNVSTQKGFDDLYWRLRGVNTKQKPPIGKLRPLPEKERSALRENSYPDGPPSDAPGAKTFEEKVSSIIQAGIEAVSRGEAGMPKSYFPDGRPMNPRGEGANRVSSEEVSPIAAAGVETASGAVPEEYRERKRKVGRNDPCPCGSGKKYKNCCGNVI